MDDNFIFRSGKYIGKTYKFVLLTNPSYISWCEQNKPKMLMPTKQNAEPKPSGPRIEPPEKSDLPKSSAMKPNLNFLNEKSNHPEESKDSNQLL